MVDHIVIGAGPVGSAVARLLAEDGQRVGIVSESGGGPEHPLIERRGGDVGDAAQLTELTRGATVLYNCVNLPLTSWTARLPALSAATIAAARAHDAVLAITGNLYVYGPRPDGRMDEHTAPAATSRKGRLRVRMWQDALAAGIRTFEVRGSDYIGAHAFSILGDRLLPALARGRAAWLPADVDLPHTWTYVGDVARTLVALAGDSRAWGHAWHVPSSPDVSIREMAARFAEAAGREPVPLRAIPRAGLRAVGLFSPMARETVEISYKFYGPFRLDSTLTARTFGLAATDLDVAIREQVDASTLW
ncbi:NAD-dependent epimerase [Streptomyces sp. CRN 30]|uniref:NAD-dependent epimerase n=1 Tax=Streptomyces sp. CRN 30 TaxID=3075613 RepID=UPI002A7EE4D9|nr:NAD-dependent epimerase [Streptomyces sp. CRN 30]